MCADNLRAQEVLHSGAMRQVMKQGQLHASIHLDTISKKSTLNGIGPAAQLKGELLAINGQSWQARVIGKDSVIVEETWNVGAPFYVYNFVESWEEIAIPDSVTDLRKLESWLHLHFRQVDAPFAFRLDGVVSSASVHVLNLPEGTRVSSHSDAHKGKVQKHLVDREAQLLGYFSRHHQGIFTHHDSFFHLHLITSDRKLMGHVDDLQFRAGNMKLLIPRS